MRVGCCTVFNHNVRIIFYDFHLSSVAARFLKLLQPFSDWRNRHLCVGLVAMPVSVNIEILSEPMPQWTPICFIFWIVFHVVKG